MAVLIPFLPQQKKVELPFSVFLWSELNLKIYFADWAYRICGLAVWSLQYNFCIHTLWTKRSSITKANTSCDAYIWKTYTCEIHLNSLYPLFSWDNPTFCYYLQFRALEVNMILSKFFYMASWFLTIPAGNSLKFLSLL